MQVLVLKNCHAKILHSHHSKMVCMMPLSLQAEGVWVRIIPSVLPRRVSTVVPMLSVGETSDLLFECTICVTGVSLRESLLGVSM